MELFTRSSRAVDLTVAGHEVLPLARPILAAQQRLSTWVERRSVVELRIGFTHVGPPVLLGNAFARAPDVLGNVDLAFRKIVRDDIADLLVRGSSTLHSPGVRCATSVYAQ